MALILVDALPSGQVLINTDHLIQARKIDGQVTIYLSGGNEVGVPHESVIRLFDALTEDVPIA